MLVKHKVGRLKLNEIFMKISSFKNQRAAYKRTNQRCIKDCSGFCVLNIKTFRARCQMLGTGDTNDYAGDTNIVQRRALVVISGRKLV